MRKEIMKNLSNINCYYENWCKYNPPKKAMYKPYDKNNK